MSLHCVNAISPLSNPFVDELASLAPASIAPHLKKLVLEF